MQLVPDEPPHVTLEDWREPGATVKSWILKQPDGPRVDAGVDGASWSGSWFGLTLLFDVPSLPAAFAALVLWDPTPYIHRLEFYARHAYLSGDSLPGLSSTMLRKIPVSSMVFEVVALTADYDANGVQPMPFQQLRRHLERGRPIGASDDLLGEVARQYQLAVQSGSRAPTADVGKVMGYSRSHAARLVGRARAAGLLGAARRGKGGV
jgi:hypothetical protein